jgi:hypothetical protein
MKTEQATLLIEDLKRKKRLALKYDGPCAGCGEGMQSGDEFIFMGEKSRICLECADEMIATLENLRDETAEDDGAPRPATFDRNRGVEPEAVGDVPAGASGDGEDEML